MFGVEYEGRNMRGSFKFKRKICWYERLTQISAVGGQEPAPLPWPQLPPSA